ncbi:MAG: helix-turn-helix transcriptional regulator [Acidimicrobiia bacterium]
MQNDRLLTLEQVAGYLQVPVKTLYDWRHRGLGPRGLRVGRYVRYRQADVDAWLDTCVDPGRCALGMPSQRAGR